MSSYLKGHSRRLTPDLDWQTTFPDRRDRPSWQCGNQKSLKRTVSDFSSHSSMHGIHYVCSDDPRTSIVKKIFYRLFVFCCILATLASVAFLSLESFRTESVFISSTSKESSDGVQEDPYFPKQPRITLCRSPAYKTDLPNASSQELVEYAYLSLNYPYPSLTPLERTRMIGLRGFQLRHPNKTLPKPLQDVEERLQALRLKYDAYKAEVGPGFSLRNYIVDNSIKCKEMFVRCIALVFNLECCAIFLPVLTPRGNCFVMNLGKVFAKFGNGQKAAGDMEFTFDLSAVPHTGKAVSNGYEIHLSDQRNAGGYINSEQYESMMNGFTTVMKTRLIKTSRTALYTPWHGLFAECPQLPSNLDPMNYGDRYFKDTCNSYFMGRMTRKRCGCRNVLEQSNSSFRVCDPVDIYKCFVGSALMDNLTSMTASCVDPCLEYHYKSEVNFVKIGDENMSRLVFTYEEQQYALHEYRKTTVSGFLSKIGGALGLYLGASLITVLEVVTFGVAWLWYSIVPTRTRPRKTKAKGRFYY